MDASSARRSCFGYRMHREGERLAAADDLRVPMPLASLLRDRLLTLLAQGDDTLDWSAIGHLAARDAGSAGS